MKKFLALSMVLVSTATYSASNTVVSSSVLDRVVAKLSGRTPLHEIVERDDFRSFRVLLNTYLDAKEIAANVSGDFIDKKDVFGRTPLTLSLQKHGYSRMTRYLLKAGARIDTSAVVALLQIMQKQEQKKAQKPGYCVIPIMAQVKAFQEHNKRSDILELLSSGIKQPFYTQLVDAWGKVKQADVDNVKIDCKLSFFFYDQPFVVI